VGALNLVTSNERLSSHVNNNPGHPHIPTKNGGEKANGHGQLGSPGLPNPAVQAAIAAQVSQVLSLILNKLKSVIHIAFATPTTE